MDIGRCVLDDSKAVRAICLADTTGLRRLHCTTHAKPITRGAIRWFRAWIEFPAGGSPSFCASNVHDCRCILVQSRRGRTKMDADDGGLVW